MAIIKNVTTNETHVITCLADGIDILSDVLGGSGFESDDEGWLLDSEDIEWWSKWAEREERITAAYERADDEVRKACEQAVIEWGYDLGLLQDEQEKILFGF